METISQILLTINTLSTYIYIFKTNIEPLTLLKHFPPELSNFINNIEFIRLLNDCISALSKLNEYLKTNSKLIKKYTRKKKHHPKQDIPYANFFIDEPPLIGKPETVHIEDPVQLSFEDILLQKNVKPVKRRKPIEYSGSCPHCGAPNNYLYDNNGKGTQFLCKACDHTFSTKITPKDETGFYCPHCKHKLNPHHDRDGYVVYYCPNHKCSYYLNNKNIFEKGNKETLLTSSKQYRFRYHYREFKFNLETLSNVHDQIDTKVDLTKIHYDQKVLGLVLTYYINYGLSSRKVASILRDIHGIRISHQTIMNYAASVSSIVKGLVDTYPYKLSNTLSGDETYVDVLGKQHYVFFFSDPIKKIITSYKIFPNRDTKCACEALLTSFNKYDTLPDDLLIITDGNPIYNAAQVFFDLNGIQFDLIQVVGLTNKDATAKKYRPFKQIEERLNRTYKQNYYGTNGYNSLKCANQYMVLYVAFFNFLRKHSSLNFKTPVDDSLFDEASLMPDKWLQLIELSSNYLAT